MKKLQVFIALVLVTIISSCSKDDAEPTSAPTNFDEIKMSDIQAKNNLMSNTTIKASDAAGIKWENGTVVIFKTNAGLY
jgi:PBP1b-binding outer membrane lipoprotein LpoB